MSVIGRARGVLLSAWAAAACLSVSGGFSACAVFEVHEQSTVAQGKYYEAGQPRYDDFFIGLFLLQVQMEQAPRVPELERLNLAHALGLAPQASTDQVEQRLHDEALKLSRSGLRMRLDESPGGERPEVASAAVRTSERPKENPVLAWITQVETSATRLVRSVGEMKQAEVALASLETTASGLDAAVEKDFTGDPASRVSEVRKNLADAHALIALMKARASSVRTESEGLVTRVAMAVNTDDGSLETPAEPASAAPDPSESSAKKNPPKSRPAPAKALQRATPRAAVGNNGKALPKGSPKPNKTQSAARDFEP